MALGALWLLFAAPGIYGQKAPAAAMPPLPAEISIRMDAHTKTATVGDPIRLDLDISMPQGYLAEIPKPVVQSADCSIMDFLPGPALPDASKSQESARSLAPQAGENKNGRGKRNNRFQPTSGHSDSECSYGKRSQAEGSQKTGGDTGAGALAPMGYYVGCIRLPTLLDRLVFLATTTASRCPHSGSNAGSAGYWPRADLTEFAGAWTSGEGQGETVLCCFYRKL